MTNNKNLYYLHELSDYKVASDYPDVRDWKVIDAQQKVIGKVDGLLVNKEAERVVYLDVEVDETLIELGHQPYSKPSNHGVHEFLNADGDNHLIVPIGMVTLDEENKKVISNQIDKNTFAKTKRFKKGTNIDKSYELIVLPNYSPDSSFTEESNATHPFYDRKEFKHL